MNKKGQKKVSMPSSFGGIVQYFNEYNSSFELKPGHVIFFSIIVIVAALVLHIIGPSIFGF